MQSLLGHVSLFLGLYYYVGKNGYRFVRGCIGYYFDGSLNQLIVALHPLVLFIAMCLTSEDAGYD